MSNTSGLSQLAAKPQPPQRLSLSLTSKKHTSSKKPNSKKPSILSSSRQMVFSCSTNNSHNLDELYVNSLLHPVNRAAIASSVYYGHNAVIQHKLKMPPLPSPPAALQNTNKLKRNGGRLRQLTHQESLQRDFEGGMEHEIESIVAVSQVQIRGESETHVKRVETATATSTGRANQMNVFRIQKLKMLEKTKLNKQQQQLLATYQFEQLNKTTATMAVTSAEAAKRTAPAHQLPRHSTEKSDLSIIDSLKPLGMISLNIVDSQILKPNASVTEAKMSPGNKPNLHAQKALTVELPLEIAETAISTEILPSFEKSSSNKMPINDAPSKENQHSLQNQGFQDGRLSKQTPTALRVSSTVGQIGDTKAEQAVSCQTSNMFRCPSVQSLEKTVLNTQRKDVLLSDEDKRLYGDRFIEGYTKCSLLGKGGFAAVWLAVHDATKKQFAVKQINRQNGSDSHAREIRVNDIFFGEQSTAASDSSKQLISQDPCQSGLNELLRRVETHVTSKDVFIVYELGGASLSNELYAMKGEFYKGQRLYRIDFTAIHRELFQTKQNNLLRSLLSKLLCQLALLSHHRIVHSDIKPENILVQLNQDKTVFDRVSLIDFGSSFSLNDRASLSMATPEYLPPEMLTLFLNKPTWNNNNSNNSSNSQNAMTQIGRLNSQVHAWSVDIWCAAASLLEVLTGIPHWLSYKCRVIDTFDKTKSSIKQGLFSTKAQDLQKIIQKQTAFCEEFNGNMKSLINLFDCHKTAKKFNDLLKKMMKFNPMERISPADALNHPFFMQNNENSSKGTKSCASMVSGQLEDAVDQSANCSNQEIVSAIIQSN